MRAISWRPRFRRRRTARQNPMQPHRFTIDDYHRMSEAGILGPEDRVELVRGEVVEMTPIGSPHSGCVLRLNRLLARAVGERAIVGIQSPITMSEHSELQPDVFLARPRADDYTQTHPRPDEILLLIEVADTSIAHDREVKLPLYAEAGIAEVWLVDLNTCTVDVCREPAGSIYGKVRRARIGHELTPLAFPDLTVRVAAFLG